MTYGSHESPPSPGEQPGASQWVYGEPWQPNEQPAYSQPQYGQQPYVPPPPGGYAPPPAAATPYVPPRRQRGVGIVGLLLAVIGAVAVLLAFLVFSWFRSSGSSQVFRDAQRSKFSHLHQRLDLVQHQLSGNPAASRFVHLGVAPAYFSWLGWLLFGVAVALALLAVLPFRGAVIFRVFGLLVGLAGVGFTLWAIDLIRVTGPIATQLGGRAPGYGDWISHTFVGAWLALGGFLLLAIAAAIGPRRSAV